MPQYQADLMDEIKKLRSRVEALEAASRSRWGVTYRSDTLTTEIFRVNTDSPAVSFWGVTPTAQQPHPSTLSDVINVLTVYGLTA